MDGCMRVETLSLISTIQAMVLAAMLWVGSQGGVGPVRKALRLRAAALAVESGGWALLAWQAYLSAAAMVLGGNALNLLAQAMGIIALRLLLNEPLRWRLVAAIGVVGWLGLAWFGMIHPDYRYRVLWGTVIVFANIYLNAEVLLKDCLRRASRASAVLLVICMLAAALLVWRNAILWISSEVLTNVAQQSPVNTFYVLFSGMQPLFASIGFLLLYGEILQRELRALARVDPLTGVNNRRALDERATELLARAARRGRPLGILMLDADHFKSVNDRFGHSGGDTVLVALVANIRATLREDDVIGRIGGEEFVVLAPDTSLDDALSLAERIRVRIEHEPLQVNGGTLYLTASIGTAVALPGERDMASILRRADAALYAAKRSGRNRVMVADPDVEEGSRVA
jgi:diguanylate cyclase (GGDEF)-like protein